jgi:hypothetical protein
LAPVCHSRNRHISTCTDCSEPGVRTWLSSPGQVTQFGAIHPFGESHTKVIFPSADAPRHCAAPPSVRGEVFQAHQQIFSMSSTRLSLGFIDRAPSLNMDGEYLYNFKTRDEYSREDRYRCQEAASAPPNARAMWSWLPCHNCTASRSPPFGVAAYS